MANTCPNSFQCGREKGELGNTIALLEMENKNLEAKIKHLKQPKPPQFTDEHIWLETWLHCTPKIDSDQAAIWARIAVEKYNKEFNKNAQKTTKN